MTNVQLLALAVICVAGAVWVSVKRTSAAWAPSVLAIIMLFLALSGPVWEWSKYGGTGAALPPSVKAAAFSVSEAVPAFLWASIGAGLSALIVARLPVWTLPSQQALSSKSISRVVAVVSAVAFFFFLIGSGPSFLRREVYLQNDGPMLILHASWPFGVIFGVLGTVMIAMEPNRRLRYWLIANSFLWFIGPFAVGSRTAVAVPALGGILIISNSIRERRIHLPMIAAALTLIAVAVFTFSAVNRARDMPHGLLNIPGVVEATASDMIDSTDSVLLPVKQLVASVVAAYPDAEQSAIWGIDPGVLIANANPLPGTAQPEDIERYWPYQWAPLSFVGTWFGAMGWAAQLLLFAALGWVVGLTMHNLQQSRFRLISFLPLGLAALTGMVSIEYPSRMVWRLISLCLLLLVVSYLVRYSRRRQLEETTLADEQAPKAFRDPQQLGGDGDSKLTGLMPVQ
ncbi:MAG: hypothetical protein JO044_08955 [Mycobacteriaceae bacterium]|nr:hypothetical protein [Mycobacteriaceae bacterium]